MSDPTPNNRRAPRTFRVERRGPTWSWIVWTAAGAVVGQDDAPTYGDARRDALKLIADRDQSS
jgi:hypothetical protein